MYACCIGMFVALKKIKDAWQKITQNTLQVYVRTMTTKYYHMTNIQQTQQILTDQIKWLKKKFALFFIYSSHFFIKRKAHILRCIVVWHCFLFFYFVPYTLYLILYLNI